MAEDLGCSVVTVWRGIRDLEQAGLVEQKRGGYGKPNVVRPLAGPVPQKPGAQSLPKEGPEPSQRRDRPFPKKGRVVTTQEGENSPARALRRTGGEDGESARAVESAGGRDDEAHAQLLELLIRCPIIVDTMFTTLTHRQIAELSRMVDAGEAVEVGAGLTKTIELTQEAQP
jgi:hypothetical protein